MRTPRAKLIAVLLVCGLAALLAGGAGSAPGSPLTGEWHRLSVDPSHAAPEHEGRLYLSEEERDRLGYLLAQFGVGIGRKEAEEQTVEAD